MGIIADEFISGLQEIEEVYIIREQSFEIITE